mgnify:CR=1 FL=1
MIPVNVAGMVDEVGGEENKLAFRSNFHRPEEEHPGAVADATAG